MSCQQIKLALCLSDTITKSERLLIDTVGGTRKENVNKSRGGIPVPGNFWWGCAAWFSKSWPYLRWKNVDFPHPFSNLEVVTKRNITCLHKTEIMSSLLRLKPQQKDFLKSISNSYYTFFLIPLELKRRTHWYTTVVPLLL